MGRAIDVIQHYVSGGAVNSDTNVKTTTSYDGLGETTQTTDAKNIPHLHLRCPGRPDQRDRPMSRLTRMGYDGTGTLRWRMTPDGRVTVYNVDGMGRVTITIANYHTGTAGAATDQDLITTTVYDAAGRRCRRWTRLGSSPPTPTTYWTG